MNAAVSIKCDMYPKTATFLNGAIYINDELDSAWGAFERAFDIAQVKYCLMLLTGLSGVGKSRLIQRFVDVKNQTASEQQTYGAAVHLTLNTPTTVKALLMQILNGIGVYSSENINARTDKDLLFKALINTIKEHNIQMLFIDEVQTVLPQKREKRAQDMADALKRLLEESQIAIVLSGTPDAVNLFKLDYRPDRNTSQVNTDNRKNAKRYTVAPALLDNTSTENQLGSRLQRHLTLNHIPPADEWMALLDYVQEKLKVDTEVMLNKEEMAARLYVLTEGNMRTLFNNLVVAHITAEKESRPINMDDLVVAFDSPFKNHPLVESIENIVHLLPTNQTLIGVEKVHA